MKSKAFKLLAKEAKARLLGNKYEETVSQKKKTGRVFVVDTKPAEDELYQRVCKIIEGDFVANPIGELMSQDWLHLGEIERTRHVFKLTEKYNSLLQRYRKEKQEQFQLAQIL